MKFKIYFIFIICCVNTNYCYADNESSYDKLKDLLVQFEKDEFYESKISKSDYNKLIVQSEKYLENLNKPIIEPKYEYSELPSYDKIASHLGSALTPYKDRLLYNAKTNKHYGSFLGLSMLQDTSIVNTILGTIIKSNDVQEKLSYIKLLALFGNKVKDRLLILNYIKKQEWHPKIIELIQYVTTKINSDNANSGWARYLLWKEMKNMTIDLKCDTYHFYDGEKIDNPKEDNSTSSRKKSLSKKAINNLVSLGFSMNSVARIWDDSGVFKYIINSNDDKKTLTAIDSKNKIYKIQVGRWKNTSKEVYDLFTIEDRVFFITSIDSFNETKYIDELIWDFKKKKYILINKFILGNRYKKLEESDLYYLINGEQWKYKINKRNAYIESGNLCGKSVKINQTL